MLLATESRVCIVRDVDDFYGDGARSLQDRFGTRRLADRLENVTLHVVLSEDDRRLVEAASFFFLATTGPDGWPDCSYKGGLPGFVRCPDEGTVAFPSYDGNGMFRSLGNTLDRDRVSLLFVDFEARHRLRIQGRASLSDDPGDLAGHDGAQLVVRVAVERVFPNCPRYLHRMALVEYSVYAPRPGHVPPEPDWKRSEAFRDVVP